MKFKEVDEADPNEKKIIFEKHGKSIPVDSLSTGEKQIVFRGTQLLRNMNSIKGGVVLVDEPELSMHPRWQEKILDYYNKLFIKDNIQLAQMIFATHSEYVIKSALQNSQNTLIIVLKEKEYGNTQYETLCTYIRNAIDHPDSGNTYTKEELRTSIEFLIKLCKQNDT